MYLFMLIVIGLLVFLIIHPFVNRNSGKSYTDRLTKIYGGFVGPIVVSIVGSWFGDTLLSGIGPEIQSFSVIGGLIGAIILVCIWDYVLIRANKK
ncbi:MAG: GlsB/YeaQ/YmgE family stress response membrane protein [Thermoanaerobacteraceae bacterium]|nr:GlsB/YeaQ/YmgE family stress response membrane protein [Thermoanaerobacteraceae bacterium]